jgi:hypothetical protein
MRMMAERGRGLVLVGAAGLDLAPPGCNRKVTSYSGPIPSPES